MLYFLVAPNGAKPGLAPHGAHAYTEDLDVTQQCEPINGCRPSASIRPDQCWLHSYVSVLMSLLLKFHVISGSLKVVPPYAPRR